MESRWCWLQCRLYKGRIPFANVHGLELSKFTFQVLPVHPDLSPRRGWHIWKSRQSHKGPIRVVGSKTPAVTKRSEREQLYTSWVDHESVGGNSCSQFVDSENFGHYDGDIRERKGDPQRSTRRGMILTQIGGGYVTLSREKLKCGGCMVLPRRTCSGHASIRLPRRKTETRDLQDPEPSQRRLSRYP